MTSAFFFDSYAILELLQGNPNYANYSEQAVFTKLNLFEVYCALIREGKVEEAEGFLKENHLQASDFDAQIIAQAAFFRLENSARRISMTDAIGYALSLRLGIKFLTGDKEFQGFENVEFVK